MHTTANRDVWRHIVKYFRFSWSYDSAADAKINKSTLLSIALVRSELTAVAISELWRSIKSLEPIIYAFNPPPFQTPSPAFEYKHDNNSDYWKYVHGSDLVPNDVKSRVLDYLSHVQYFLFPVFPSSKERALWQALQAFNWISPLCPNLRGITFAGENNPPSMAYHLVPFLVPSVRSITFDSAITQWDEETVMMILGMIKQREIQISHITYAGYATRRVVKHIFQFSTLRSAKMHITSGYRELLDTSDIVSFRPTLLTNLYLDVGMFQPTSQVGFWIERLQSLSTLTLRGATSLITDCLQKQMFVLVHSLTLLLRHPNRTPSFAPRIFAVISTTFPNLHNLHLQNMEGHNIMNAAISLSDIDALRERPMRCLVICCLRLSLTTSNVIDVVETWPTLERLSLVPDPRISFERYDASQLLPYISRHAPHVTDLNLPLDMSSFIAQPSTARMAVCSLHRLEMTHVQNLPSSLEEKLVLARKIITLFPRLEVVTSNLDVRELQLIVTSFREVLSSLLIRNDNLY